MDEANLIDYIDRALPAAARKAIVAIVQHAQDEALTVYLVGGSVRDLLLNRPTLDVDLTLEGDAPALARRVAIGLQDVRCTPHSAFGTATLKGADFRLALVQGQGGGVPLQREVHV